MRTKDYFTLSSISCQILITESYLEVLNIVIDQTDFYYSLATID